MLEELVGHERGRGHLDHHPGRLQAVGAGLLREGLGLLGRGDHRGHDPHLRLGGGLGLGQGLELVVQDLGVAARRAVGAHTERRVGLGGVGQEGQRLVSPGVEGAHHDLLAGEGLEDTLVGLHLSLHRGLLGLVQEAELGAEQADAHGSGLGGATGAGRVTDIGQQLDLVAVLRGSVAVEDTHARGELPRPAQSVLGGVEGDASLGAVDQDDVALGQRIGDLLASADDRRHAQCARQDRGVGGGAALGGDEGDDLLGVQQRGVGRGQVGRHEHEGLGQAGDPGHRGLGQDGDDAVAHVLDVTGALGHVAAQGLQHGGQSSCGLPHGALRNQALLAHHGLRRRGQGGVGSHLRGGLKKRARLGLGLGRGQLQALLNLLGRQRDALALLLDIATGFEGRDLGLRNGRCHPGDWAGHKARAHTDAGQGCGGGVGRCHVVLLIGDEWGSLLIVPRVRPERDVSARGITISSAAASRHLSRSRKVT